MKTDCEGSVPHIATKPCEDSATGNYGAELLKRAADEHPENDALLHGQVRECRSCGCETMNDCFCDACAAARGEERRAALEDLLRRRGVQQVEQLSDDDLREHQETWRRS